MKKIYLTTVSALLLFSLSSAFAQTFNITTAGRTWSNTVGPAGNYSNVIINLNANAVAFTVDVPVNCTTCTINAAGNASNGTLLNIQSNLTLNASTITLNRGAAGTISNFSVLALQNGSTLNVGAGAASTATLTLNDGRIIVGTPHVSADASKIAIAQNSVVTLDYRTDTWSNIRVGNTNNLITTGNGTTRIRVQTGTSTFTTILGASASQAGPVISNATGFVSTSPLPIVLVDFKAVLNNNKTISLSWSTQQEVNSNYFSVLRSADGTHWESIGTVSANMNAVAISNYSFTDKSPADGANYYRLEAVDLDGKYGFTEIRVIRAAMLKAFTVFPNPANSIVNVTLTNKFRGSVRLYNQFGQLLLQRSVNADKEGTTVTLPVHNFPAGHYMLQTTQEDGTSQSEKIQIIR